MRFPLGIACIILVVNLLVDLYVYAAARSYSRNKFWYRLQGWSCLILSCAFIAAIALVALKSSIIVAMWIIFAYLSLYLIKYIFLIFDILSRIPCIFRCQRWKWMSTLGLSLGIVFFLLMWWGALIDRYQINVNHIEVVDASLPSAFDGFTLVQFSDLHTGTFGKDPSFVDKLVDEINALHPDMIVFTGDIVNQQSKELVPFQQSLSMLKAPMGVYSIMGNHDYGDYSRWKSEDERLADEHNLKAMEAALGWKMLNNESDTIRLCNDSIILIGVENIGDPPFRVAGDLYKAYHCINDGNFKILLSHNPAHWTEHIENNPNSNINLTLSGHTHAMQMELFGFSPARFRYPKWGGMYADDKGQKLYVNIGAGEVGFPARIGATPEVTFFTFKSK